MRPRPRGRLSPCLLYTSIKLNVQPVTISIYHEYVFEGPCRFGEGEQLTKDYDLMRLSLIHI